VRFNTGKRRRGEAITPERGEEARSRNVEQGRLEVSKV